MTHPERGRPGPAGPEALQLRILGPLEVLDPAGALIEPGTPKQRALLALLATRPGRVVSVPAIIDELWADEPPERAVASLQAYVSRLRRALEPGRVARGPARVLVSRAPGYLLAVPPEAVDAVRFADAVQRARDGDDPRGPAAALALWRGDPLPELGDSPIAQGERARLRELRFVAVERLGAAWLARGRYSEVVVAAEGALAEAPYRESLWGLLMRALYRSGRRAEALAAVAKARAMLADELGLEPGPELRRLEAEILRKAPAGGGRPPADQARQAATRPPGTGQNQQTATRPPGTGQDQQTAARPPGTGQDQQTATRPSKTRQDRQAATQPPETGQDRQTATRPREAAPGPPDELVGREREIAAIDAVLARPGRVLAVEGAAGIGKSALLDEAVRRAGRLGFVAGRGTGVDGPQPPVFLPWAQVLRGLAEQAPGEVAEAFAPFGNLPAVLDPALAGVIGLPRPERLADAGAARSRLLRGLAEGLRRLSARRPVLVVLDDAHRLDRPSRALLAEVLAAVPGARLVVALATRTGETAPSGQPQENAHTVRLPLEGLSAEDVARLGRRLTRRPLAPGTLAVLVERTGGNPFFVGELLRALDAGHALDERWAREHTPARVQEVVRHRLARLPEPLRAMLGVAAVLGREFDTAILRDMAPPGGVEGEDAALALGILTRAGGDRLRFAHDLLRQGAYEGQGALRRAGLHARAAEVLLRHGRGATERAAHLRLALPVAGAAAVAPVLAAAAGEAYERTAHDEAVAFLQEAAAVLDKAPPSRERDVAELDVRVRLAFTHQAIGDYLGAAAAEQYARMEPVFARVGPGPELVAALWGYASFHTAAGDDARVAAIAALDPVVADVHAGYAAHARAELPRAGALLRGALDALAARPLPVFPVIDWDPLAGVLGPAASVASLLGDRAGAEALLARAGRATPFADMYVSSYAAAVAADWHDRAAVRERAGRTLALAERVCSREYRATASVLLGWADGDEARLAAGEQALGETLWRYPRLLPLRPDLLLRAGRGAPAAALARARLATPPAGLNRFAEPDLRRVLGVAGGDRAQLRRAAAVARALGHAPALARIGTALA